MGVRVPLGAPLSTARGTQKIAKMFCPSEGGTQLKIILRGGAVVEKVGEPLHTRMGRPWGVLAVWRVLGRAESLPMGERQDHLPKRRF